MRIGKPVRMCDRPLPREFEHTCGKPYRFQKSTTVAGGVDISEELKKVRSTEEIRRLFEVKMKEEEQAEQTFTIHELKKRAKERKKREAIKACERGILLSKYILLVNGPPSKDQNFEALLRFVVENSQRRKKDRKKEQSESKNMIKLNHMLRERNYSERLNGREIFAKGAREVCGLLH